MEFFSRNYQHFHTNHFQKHFQLADSNVYYTEFCIEARTTTLDTFSKGFIDNIHNCLLVNTEILRLSVCVFTDSLNFYFLQNLKEIEI